MTVEPLGVIADDFTGATDVAAALRRAGLETLLFFGVPRTSVDLPPHDAVVVALKSRSISPDLAVAQSLDAARWLRAHGAGQLYFKYCSTFDSTPRGNIGPVLDALVRMTGADRVVTTPSSPEHGRTVYRGYLFVGDVLLSESPMRTHPLNPMTDSSLPRVLMAQSAHGVAVLPRAGDPDASPSMAGDRPVRYLIADALDDEDLLALAQKIVHDPLVAGAAGLAGALGRVRQRSTDATEGEDPPAGPVAVLAGSCSARTLEQIAAFEEAGGPSRRLDALSSADPARLAGEALDWVDGLPAGSAPLIYSSLPPAELARVQEGLGAEQSAALLESALAAVATGLRERGIRRLLVAGGETSGAVVAALGIDGVRVGAEAAPGVPWIESLGEDPIALLLKSGNFGERDLFTRVAGSRAA